MPKSRAVLLHWPTLIAVGAVVAVALVIFFGGARAAGAGSADDPSDFVRSFGEQVIATVADESLSPGRRRAALAQVLAAGIDSRVIGRFVLAQYGRRASDAERAEFDRLFAAGIVATYARHLGRYAGESLQVGGAKILDDGDVIVDSRVVRPAGPAVAVEWRLHGEAGARRIVDVVIEGVSMALTLRSEYAAAIRAGGGRIEGLLVRLRAQAATLDAEAVRVAADGDGKNN